ncbi:MAG TPA: nitronate monooxygenase family protein [Candidatus Binataceae bacterium]|jgi:NAD(P)H-dependent flavin oxidoreductase YrpB (nitropropane dioxygenase family)|nr:nitronate monooxygenase family protein [Candidatus Binataceae bacterium]
MKNQICEMLGIEFPLVAFSHCRDVVTAVSRAGGFGVLGATAFSPSSLEEELKWIDEHIGGKPYGVDVLIPENLAIKGESGVTARTLHERIPQSHRDFVNNLLTNHGIEPSQVPQPSRVHQSGAASSLQEDQAMKLLAVAFEHPIKLVANALGVPPQSMLEMGRKRGVPVAALVGAPEHAVRQAKAGVDIIIAEGWEAGGHCSEISTMVLIPEVLRAIKPIRNIPVLAAGGIMTGRQMAACMAMGAAGVWTGSVWLATTESETTEIFREKMVAARSRDTVRSKCRTGKYSRQLKSAWTEAWEGPDSPAPLPMPYQTLLSEPALAAAQRAAERGNPKAREMVTYFVGQGVGLVDSIKSARVVVNEFMQDFAEALSDMAALTED